MPTHVFSGARAQFFYDGDQIGYASGVSGSEEIMYDEVDILDHIEVMENVPVKYRVRFSAEVFRTISPAASTSDSPGSLKELGLFPKFEQILTLEGVDAVIKDSQTAKTIFMVTQCKPENYDFNIRAGAITQQNIRFNAIRAMDESEIKATAA